MKALAPIVLFAYARPEHTRRTLQALSKNILARESHLFVFCDGPKKGANDETLNKIKEVRSIVKEQQWCSEVTCYFSEYNKGLASSIRSGVTEILNRFSKIIVLEDDLETSPAFLSYMNRSLDCYEEKRAVFSIGAYTYPPEKMQIPPDYEFDNYVCLRNCSWGWATWKDRWDKVDWSVKNYDFVKNSSHCRQALNRMGDDEFDLLYSQQEQGLDIWSIQFTMAHFEQHAVAMCPCVSYVNNIGLDGSGVNCGVQKQLCNRVLNSNETPKLLEIIYEDKRIINAFYNVNCRKHRPLWQKACNFIMRKLGRKPLFVIKKKVYC